MMTEDFDPSKISKVTNERFRQWYHIQTPGGWLNDPNGLCFFKGYYHVFYQFHPYSAEWGPMHWGHIRSKDLVHWEQLPIALTPGAPEDSGGCFSGSAVVKDGRLYLFYTGHNYYGDGDLDHFWENQNMAYSDDGLTFHKYAGNPLIKTPADNTSTSVTRRYGSTVTVTTWSLVARISRTSWAGSSCTSRPTSNSGNHAAQSSARTAVKRKAGCGSAPTCSPSMAKRYCFVRRWG